MLRELSLFAGAGGGILGGQLLGWRTVCAVEIDPFCREVLLRRQLDGCLPRFPIWDDIQTFDGRPWRGYVDVISGGFPCQDISCAGQGVGITGERSGLWGQMARVVCEVRPKFVFVENSPMLTSRGLGRVLGDLAEMGFDARWGVFSAGDAGARHKRERIWIVAHADGIKEEESPSETSAIGIEKWLVSMSRINIWWQTEPSVGRVVHGVANQLDRLWAIGNGQIPAVAALAWRVLNGGD